MFPKLLPTLVISYTEIGKNATRSGFSLQSNSFSLDVLAAFPPKTSQDRFSFSKADSEKYMGFSTLLRSPDKSILPRLVGISGEIDVCGKP